MVLACLIFASIPSAVAALPTYGGAVSFPSIEGPSGPEEYSWEVVLGEGQELRLVDNQHAAVYYTEGDRLALEIDAIPAHDAARAEVPTSLAVSEGNVITLTVHHRGGNPVADGAPFVYPVLPGPPPVLIVGPGEIVTGPLDEQELREAQERMERENRPAEVANVGPVPTRCLVPRLNGRSLRAAARRLRQANCKLGRVSKQRGARAKTGKVIKQNPKAGSLLAQGAAVNVKLGGTSQAGFGR